MARQEPHDGVRRRGLEGLGTPDERLLANRVSGALFLVAAFAALTYVWLDPRLDPSWPVVAGALIGAVWGTVVLVLKPLAQPGRWWLDHLSCVAGLGIVAAIYVLTDGSAPGVLAFLWFVVVFAALFHHPAAVAGYLVAVGVLHVGLTLAVPSPMEDPAEALVRCFAYAVVGGSIAAAGRVLQRRNAETESVAAGLRERTAEQAALRRVATAVAAGSPPRAVFALLAAEASRLLGAQIATVARFMPGDQIGFVGVWGQIEGLDLEVGTLKPTRELPGHREVRAYGEPVRLATVERCVVSSPILLHNEPWGALSVAARDERDLPPDTESRLVELAELAATCVANAEDRARLDVLTATDALTGLANRAAFLAALDGEAARARRHGRPLAVVLLDADRFSRINDRAGTAIGDQVLAELGQLLRAMGRTEDVVARLGGDEFAILLPEADRRQGLAVAQRIRSQVAASAFAGRERLTVTVGVTDLEISASPDALVRDAQRALYWGKAHGRDRAWQYDSAIVGALEAEERRARDDRDGTLSGLRALARAVDAKDPATSRHAERVAGLAVRLAGELGWPPARRAQLREAALLHDVGKIGVPDQILLKAGPLDDEEWAVVRTHPELGALIVGDVLSGEQVAWIAAHHERPDGRGYPRGLAGDEVPEGAALIALADAFDVMTSHRAYQDASPLEHALAECRALAGHQFAPAAVAALERLAETNLLVGDPVTRLLTSPDVPQDLG
jgi:diguanylate cyclase (GGDEF)-like protein